MQVLSCGLLVAFAGGVAAWDLRSRRIPNWLTVAGALGALGLSALAGRASVLQSLGGLGVAFAVGLLLYSFKTLGAGDAKFMAAIGAWAGLGRLPGAFLAMLGGGALFAILWSLRHRVFRATIASTSTMVDSVLSGGGKASPWIGNTAAGRFPYGVGLGLGAILWWFWAGCTMP